MSRLFKALVLFSTGTSMACGGSAEPDGSGGSGGAPGGAGGGGPGLDTGGSGSSDTSGGGGSGGGSITECTPAERACEAHEVACAEWANVADCECDPSAPTDPSDCEADERLVCAAHSESGSGTDVEPGACLCVVATGTNEGDCAAYLAIGAFPVVNQDADVEPLLCGCGTIVLR